MNKTFYKPAFGSIDPLIKVVQESINLANPIIITVVGLFLCFRVLAFTPAGALSFPLPMLRLACAFVLCAWGALLLGSLANPRVSRFAVWASGDARCAVVLGWSVLTSAVDMLSGASPAVFVAGAVLAAAMGWARLERFILWVLCGFVVVLLATLSPIFLGHGSAKTEDILLEMVATLTAIAVARTIRTLVVPSLRKLHSLERTNEQLWDLSYKDALTSVYNRRFAQETGPILLLRAIRYHEEFHVILIDIDHFKKINDECSHAVGDEVLRGIAQTIQSCIRAGDSVARYGGDEFLTFLVKAEGEMAQFIANRLREAVASKSFPGVASPVTVSIGIASLQGDDNLETLIARADNYLYVSKHAGRNKVAGY